MTIPPRRLRLRVVCVEAARLAFRLHGKPSLRDPSPKVDLNVSEREHIREGSASAVASAKPNFGAVFRIDRHSLGD